MLEKDLSPRTRQFIYFQPVRMEEEKDRDDVSALR
jgi:hypothetical protein